MATLFLVHAHPDDEAISTGGVMMRAHAAGHRVVLVTCTRGEEGEIHNMDEAATRPRLAEVRTEELRRAGEILGVDRQVFLGYRDSGMAGTQANADPASFHQAPLGEAAERLAAIMRDERPEVVATYGPEGGYGHPDHIKAHLTTVAALDVLEREGWRPGKFYQAAIPQSMIDRIGQLLREAGQEPPPGGIRIVATPDDQLTAVVDVRDLAHRKREAFAAHVSQNDPNGFFRSMATQIYESAFGYEAFVLARGEPGEPVPERDLFAGVAR